jgi:hypothetical protein
MKEPHSQIADKVLLAKSPDTVPLVIPSEARDLGSSGVGRKPGFLVAFASRNDRGWILLNTYVRAQLRTNAGRGTTFRGRALILCAVLSLTISVVTRFSTVAQEGTPTKIVTSQSLDAQRQHLLNNGLHWCAPAATFVLFEPAGVSLEVLPAGPPIIRPYSEDLQYSRPPPSC